MKHIRKISLASYFIVAAIALVAISTAPVASTAYAQNIAQSSAQEVPFYPLNYDGTGTNNNSATWQIGQSGYVLVGSLPSFSNQSNPSIEIYLADPSTFATGTLLLQRVPTTGATTTYAINPSSIGSHQGTYGLILDYTTDNPSLETYVTDSPVLLTIVPAPSTSSSNSNTSNNSCSYGYVYNSVLGYCALPMNSTTNCQSGYTYNPNTGFCGQNIVNAPTVNVGTGPSTSGNTNGTANTSASANTNTNTNTNATGPTGLVKCKGATDLSNPNNTDNSLPTCDFSELLIEGRTIVNWLFAIAIPIAIVLFAYGGVLYILGTPGNRSKANGIFTAAGIGFGIMLIAWVSVYTIVSWLTTGTNGSSTNQTGITTFLGQ